MELFLNLFWLLLAIPAYWVWRREDRCFSPMRSLLILACLLVLLFPVISLSDDLHAMRQEMEESSPSKRTVKQAGNAKGVAQSHTGVPPAALSTLTAIMPCEESCGSAGAFRILELSYPALSVRPGRAPPIVPA